MKGFLLKKKKFFLRKIKIHIFVHKKEILFSLVSEKKQEPKPKVSIHLFFFVFF